jgi:hypothetical protein
VPYLWRDRSEAVQAEEDVYVMWRNGSYTGRFSIALPRL